MLAAGGIQASLRTKLESLGMKVYVVDPTTYAGIMADIANIGKLAGTSAEAQKVVATMKQAQADVQAKVGSLAKRAVRRDLQQAADDGRHGHLHQRHGRHGRRHQSR